MTTWTPPPEWQTIQTIDAHTGGEPFRIVVDGLPEIEGNTVLACRRYVAAQFDHLRKALMLEPRGHPDMYGCIMLKPERPDSDLGVLFLHNEGYSTMCGHGIIALTKVLVETGWKAATHPITTLRIDTPAGLVVAHARMKEGKVKSVYFQNVPSFAAELDAVVEVPGWGEVTYDLGYGGAFYAYVEAAALDLACTPVGVSDLIQAGRDIKSAIMGSRPIHHPYDEDLSFLYGVIFIGAPSDPSHHSRNVCIFADGEVDRSPTGTGVSGRLAIHHARGDIQVGEEIIIESILGSTFAGTVLETTTFGDHRAIIPQVEGKAYITGKHTFTIDPHDELGKGFSLR